MNVSNISKTVPASPIRKLIPFANEAKAKGIQIYHLNIGDPDIETPEVMIDVIKNWSRNPISYSDSHGQSELLTSLLLYYHGLGFTQLSTHNLQITFGGSEGLLWLFLTTTNPGDEYIVFEPFYANYNSFAVMAHVKLVPVKTTIESGFHLPSQEEIEQKITPRTKGILICNPNNPTGTVYTKKELDMLFSIAKKHNLFFAADEVYREFAYDETQAVSLLSYAADYPQGIIIIDSLSKRYSLCGARLGVIVSYNDEIMATVLKFAQARLSVGLIDQIMAAKLNEVPHDYFVRVNAEYKKRRDVLYSELSAIDGVFCKKPEGAFYMIVKLPVKSSEDFAKWLLTDFQDNGETVMVAPAQGFYSSPSLGVDEIRIAYVLESSKLVRCAHLLKQALASYKNLHISNIYFS